MAGDEPNQRGSTAEGVATSRAAHTLHDPDPVFEDPWAIHLIRPGLRLLVRNRLLCELFIRRPQRPFRAVTAGSFACARWTEERLDEAMRRGVGQYVIVGAGLDSFALRRSDLADRLQVYELDHPATQRLKRERVARVQPELPKHLQFVPVDFERQSIAEALDGSSFRREAPAFCSWLGVISYLTEDATFETLDAMAAFLAPGSELVLNYPVAPEFLDPGDRAGLAALAKAVRRRGEPFRSRYDPNVFPGRVEARGYRLLAEVTSDRLAELYFQGRSDGLRPGLGARLAHFAVTGPVGS